MPDDLWDGHRRPCFELAASALTCYIGCRRSKLARPWLPRVIERRPSLERVPWAFNALLPHRPLALQLEPAGEGLVAEERCNTRRVGGKCKRHQSTLLGSHPCTRSSRPLLLPRSVSALRLRWRARQRRSHCVVEVKPDRDRVLVSTAETCFDTFADASAYAGSSGGESRAAGTNTIGDRFVARQLDGTTF